MRPLADDSTSTYYDQSPLHPQGPVGQHINTVYTPIFWVSVVIFVGVSLTILYFAFRYRRRSDDEEPEQVHGNNRLELGWTLIPFAILISLFVVTFVNMSFIDNIPSEQQGQATYVCVQGQRFNWSYFYLDALKQTTCGEQHAGGVAGTVDYTPADKSVPKALTLVVPAGRPVQLKLVSVDVNHSYFIPEIAGQVNAIPGQENEMWLQVDSPGVYHGACTELCGEQHYAMVVCIDAKTPAQYTQWYDEMRAQGKSSVKVAPCAFPAIPQ